MTDVQWPRGQSFCTYAVLPESPEVFVIEDAIAHPVYRTFWQVATEPYVRFYAAAALIIEGVRIGTLCLADVRPHKFSMQERQNLLDLGSAVAELITQRRKNYLASQQERATMMLTMMHGLRTPLFAVDIGMNVLSSKRPTITDSLERTDPTKEDATLVASTLDEVSQSVSKLKSAVESTVVLGKALAVSTVAAATRPVLSEFNTRTAENLMSNAILVDVGNVLSHLKLIASLVGKRDILWRPECEQLYDSLLAGIREGDGSDKEYNCVKSYPDALNFVLLAVLTHIVTYSVHNDVTALSVSVSSGCCTCSRHEPLSADSMAVDLTKADDLNECYLCASTNSTVTVPHGTIALTVCSPTIVAPLAGVSAFVANVSGIKEEARGFTSNLTLAPAINQVMDAIGGKYTQFVDSIREQDVFVCEIPYIGCHTDDSNSAVLKFVDTVGAAGKVSEGTVEKEIEQLCEPTAVGSMAPVKTAQSLKRARQHDE
jgi:hypothetical protein